MGRLLGQKVLHPNFHSNTHGGKRGIKFDDLTRNLLCMALWNLFITYPLGNIPFFVQELN